jgi:hypothetical protein
MCGFVPAPAMFGADSIAARPPESHMLFALAIPSVANNFYVPNLECPNTLTDCESDNDNANFPNTTILFEYD